MDTVNRFMVLDDDPINNLICKYTIRSFDGEADIKLFTEPEAALEAIKEEYGITDKNIATVLFLDINMPAMTGWEFLDIFKSFSTHIHKQFTIYILSSSVEDRDNEKAEINPFVAGFLSKPLSSDSLGQIFGRVLTVD